MVSSLQISKENTDVALTALSAPCDISAVRDEDVLFPGL